MAWRVELAESASRQIAKLDPSQRERILKFLRDRIVQRDGPRSLGRALRGSRLGEFWRYRVGDFRLICKIEDSRLTVLVLSVRHRRDSYR